MPWLTGDGPATDGGAPARYLPFVLDAITGMICGYAGPKGGVILPPTMGGTGTGTGTGIPTGRRS